MSDGPYPTIALTQRAVSVLEGRERVMLRTARRDDPADRSGRTAAGRSRSGGDGVMDLAGREDLFDELRRVRKEIAAGERVPPFTVFHDATLREMCARLPRTEEELLRVKGVGERKAAKYGRKFLDALLAWAKEKS